MTNALRRHIKASMALGGSSTPTRFHLDYPFPGHFSGWLDFGRYGSRISAGNLSKYEFLKEVSRGLLECAAVASCPEDAMKLAALAAEVERQ
jgi:hypothetical protein